MSAPLLSVSGLSKRFCRNLRRSLAYGVTDIFHELRPGGSGVPSLRRDEFWALDRVSFELRAGEALAVLGNNGAGKSTLLRLLSGMIKPDAGAIRVNGRVEALIELAAGFDPLLSGRENVVVGAAMRGLSGERAKRLLDEVVDFAEIGDFIDAPLQSYSTGMRARLGFALSVLQRPDLLLVDEVLAVGDPSFQLKCLRHLRAFVDGGGAMLLVSHNIHQIQAACGRALLLRHGRLAFQGEAVEAVGHLLADRRREAPLQAGARAPEPIAIRSLVAQGADGGPATTGQPVRISLDYRADEPADIMWGISIWTADEGLCICSGADREGQHLLQADGRLECLLPRLDLVPGRYLVKATIVDRATHATLAFSPNQGADLVLDLAAPADPFTNIQVSRGHLFEIEAQWSQCEMPAE